jgi:predicted PurR-regulated permease PerM
MSAAHDVNAPQYLPRASFRDLVETGLRLALVAALAVWCYRIIAPFLDLLIWAVILAVACRPLHTRLASALGGRAGLAAGLVATLLLLALIVPVVVFSVSVTDGAKLVSGALEAGDIHMPRPDQALAAWPLVGDALHRLLDGLATNTEALLVRLAPQLKSLGAAAFAALGRGGLALLQFSAGAIIAAALLVHADHLVTSIRALALRVVGTRGEAFLDLSTATIRSVFKGVIGVAAIQGLLAGIGIFAMGVPGAGLWALLVLILAIVQLPPLLVLGPMIIWAFASVDTLPAVLFTVWSVAVSLSDGFLKPALLGRGVSVPMLVILVGAIGGMLASGILGLFVGPVVLALAYELYTSWLVAQPETADPPRRAPGAAAPGP